MEVEEGEQPEVVSIEVEPVVVDQLGDPIVVHHLDGEQMGMEEEAGVKLVVLDLSEEAEVRVHQLWEDLVVEVAATVEAKALPTSHQVQAFQRVEVEAGAGAIVEAVEMTKRRERKEKIMVDLDQFLNLSDN